MPQSADNLKVLLSAEQIQKRVQELARQISQDYRGRPLCAVCVLENGFIFMADLVRSLDVSVVCQFIKPFTHEFPTKEGTATQILFSPEPHVIGQDVLLVEGLVQSGVTSEFLIRTLLARGATSVKLCTLLDKQAARRVSLQPDYFGFLISESYVVGYGLGSPDLKRNLPYVATCVSSAAGASR